MKNKSLILASFAVAAILSAGCVKEKNYDEIRVPGEPIRFSAQTSYENGDGTRTEYSGALYGDSNIYERIDWLANDPMKIIYVEGSDESAANYKVSSVSGTTDENSYAEVETDGGSELVWGTGTGANKFYAMYPTSAKNAYASLQKVGSNYRATGTLLPTQNVNSSKVQTVSKNGNSWSRYQPDMDYNYLLAYADDVTGITGNSVRLPFRPAVTAFEFRFQRQFGDSDRKVTKFELSSSTDALTGEFKIDITGGNAKGATWGNPSVPSRTTANSVITVNFPTGGVSLPEEGYLDFTVFALPSDLHNLTMKLTYADGKHASLPLNNKATGQPYEFIGARKYIITNSNVPGTEGWHYVIEAIDDITFVGHDPVYPIGYNVKSYAWNDREGDGVKYEVAWKTQYSLDGTTWTDVPSTGLISGSDYTVESTSVTGSGVNTSTYSAGEDRVAKLNGSSTADSGAYGPSAQDIIDDLATRTSKTDYDLSMHDVFGNTHAQTTANSYVVTAPGTYKFPVVYGNAITNGRDNVESYYPMIDGNDVGAPGVVSQLFSTVYAPNRNRNTFRYLGRFRSATNNPISKPNVVEDFEFWESETVKYGGAAGQYTPSQLEAVIVWQNSMELPGETVGHAIIQEGTVGYADGYITFTIAPEDIRPGNAVIALRGKVGNKLPAGTILWSWQIWVTANDLTPVPVQGGSLMPFNLGYIDSTGGGYISYPNRTIQFRIVQYDPTEFPNANAQEDFTVEQRGDGTAWDASVGFNVYYQWGRKDPMIPAKDYGAVTKHHPLVGDREVYPDANYVPGTGYTVNVQGNDLPGGYGNPNGNTPADFASGIQRPYNAFLNTHNSGWVGGYDNGYFNEPGWGAQYSTEAYRLNSSIPVNLWNNGMTTTMDGTQNKWKTVYDPCPPGFCVPTIGVLANFNNSTAIGEPTSDGRYFSTPNGGRIFFPFSGLRVFYNNNDGTAVIWAEQVRKGGYYWTDSTMGNVQNTNTENSYSKLFSFGRGAVNSILPITVNLDLNMRGVTDYTRGSSLAIRPMVDPKY